MPDLSDYNLSNAREKLDIEEELVYILRTTSITFMMQNWRTIRDWFESKRE